MLYITHKLIPFSTVLNFDIGSEDSIDLHSPFFSLYGLKSLNHPLEFPFIFNLGALTSIILLYLICTTKLTSLFFLNTSFSNGKSQSKLQVHVHNNTVHSLPSLLHRFFFFFFTLLHSRDPKSFFFFNHQPYPLPPTPSLLPQEQRLHNFEQTRTTLSPFTFLLLNSNARRHKNVTFLLLPSNSESHIRHWKISTVDF